MGVSGGHSLASIQAWILATLRADTTARASASRVCPGGIPASGTPVLAARFARSSDSHRLSTDAETRSVISAGLWRPGVDSGPVGRDDRADHAQAGHDDDAERPRVIGLPGHLVGRIHRN